MADDASAPGSSTYDSSTMEVGDGTWIADKNTFLLPNLQGLNFATMQYNGMSNRFSSLPEYHKLILSHGVLAAITFLLVVPSAIFIAKFYCRNPRLALRLHIWLQVLTVGLLTVVFILGWFAVGPERSLTNPHHGIGVAIYTLILVQALGGGIIHHVEKGKARWRLPLKLMLHQWLGRATALLGLVQIPLGLTLYGSPKYLFILYTLACFAWLSLYLTLTYINRPVIGVDDGHGSESYVSGPTRTQMSESHRSSRSGNHALRNAGLFGAGLTGLAALRRRSKSRQRADDTVRINRNEASPSRTTNRRSTVYSDDDEKYSAHDGEKTTHKWGNRLLGAGAGLGAYAGFKRLFSQKTKDEESSVGFYRPPTNNSQHSRADLARVQEGHAPMSPGDSRVSGPIRTPAVAFVSPTRRPLRSRMSADSHSSDDSNDSESDVDRPSVRGRGHGVRDGIATLGVLGLLRTKRKERQEKKEQRRVESLRQKELENAETINRANSRRNPARRRSSAPDSADDDPSVVGSTPGLTRNQRPPTTGSPLPASVAAVPSGSNPADPNIQHLEYDETSGIQSLPHTTLRPPTRTTGYPMSPNDIGMPSPAVEPDHTRLMDPFDNPRTTLPPTNTFVAPSPIHEPSGHNRSNSANLAGPASVGSPPVSVKVQMHRDGRHVTLRRLNEEEAAAERDARKQERRQRRRRAESLSSGVEDEGARFRRHGRARPTDSMPPPSMPPSSMPPPSMPPSSMPPLSMPPNIGRQTSELNLPSPLPAGPPPVPRHSASPQTFGPSHLSQLASGLTSGIGSPGTHDTGNGTELSAFDTNRRRRRAERAATNAGAVQQGARVDFV